MSLKTYIGALAEAHNSINSLTSCVSPKSSTHLALLSPRMKRTPGKVMDMWSRKREERVKAEKSHVVWLRSGADRRGSTEAGHWFPVGDGRAVPEKEVWDVAWGCSHSGAEEGDEMEVEGERKGYVDLHTRNRSATKEHEGKIAGSERERERNKASPAWDEHASLAFDYARSQQDTYRTPLKHIEFDVCGVNASNQKVRAQQMIEVALDVRDFPAQIQTQNQHHSQSQNQHYSNNNDQFGR